MSWSAKVGDKLINKLTGVTATVTEVFQVDDYAILKIIRMISDGGIKYSCLEEDLHKNWKRLNHAGN